MTRTISLIANPPFNPIRTGVYTADELLSGYNPAIPASVTASLDYNSYVYFQQQGRTAVTDPYAGMMEAVHDASVIRGMNAFLAQHLVAGRLPVAIMGGHREQRGSPTYRAVAKIAKLLAESGFVVASGGGPGCMEASHLGALFAASGEDELEAAIAQLATQPKLPDGMTKVLVQDSSTRQWSIDDDMAADLARWMEPARLIAEARKPALGIENQSLAVPTWHYGHEPFTPLATHIAKYFLNSIREDVLLALATSGIIYSEGRGGTLQEVFQDAAQIYYRDAGAPITSMIFLDKSFWTAPAIPDKKPHLPVRDLLYSLFVLNKKMSEDEFAQYVRFDDDPQTIVSHIVANVPSVSHIAAAFTEIGMPELSTAQITEASVRSLAFRRD